MRSGSERALLLCAAVGFSLLAACGDLSNEDIRFLSALPRATEMHVAVPVATAQPTCAIGSAAEWKKAKDTGDAINASIDAVLGMVDLIRGSSPSRRDADLRVWGPYPDQQHPGVTWQVSILRFTPPAGSVSDDAYLYSFEAFRDGTGWQTILDGFFLGAQSKDGQGELTIHFDASAKMGINKPTDPTVPMTIHYDRTGDPRTLELDIGQGGALGLDPFEYFYAGYASGSGIFDYAITDASGNHLTIQASFLASGAGKASVNFRTALGATASFSECWDASACLSYVLDPSLVTPYCGGQASCGSAASCPPVP